VIPPLRIFLQGYTHFTRARGLASQCDELRVAEGLEEAAALAADRPEDEPAALLFALSKRPRALPEGWTFVLRCADNLARVELRAEIAVGAPVTLDLLRLRVFANQASFDEVRAFVAAHLRPLR
jgi:hypothetical protein